MKMYTCKLDYFLPGEKRRVCIKTFEAREAHRLNDLGYGVFTTPNKFSYLTRAQDLEALRWCFFEIDDIPKEQQKARINASFHQKIRPSRIIESKNSFHVYYKLVDNNYNVDDWTRVQKGLIEYFKADPKIKNVNRIMRVPDFKHMKDPLDPFMVKQVLTVPRKFNIEELKKAFPYTEPVKKEYIDLGETTSDLRSWLNSVNSLDALKKLSGTQFVHFESYIFKPTSNNTVSIFVNGKSTSCFIDHQGLIGATHGPTVWQWLRYFGHTDSQIRRIIKEVFGV